MIRALLCRRGSLLWIGLSFSLVAHAQNVPAVPEPMPTNVQTAASATQSSSSPKVSTDYIETGGGYLTLGSGYGYWAGGYSRAVHQKGNDGLNAEINGQHEFGDAGIYFAVGDTHTFSPDWYGSLTIGSSAGGFFWPRFRSDTFLNKKWLVRKQWITTLGYGYFEAKDVHRNHSLFLGSTYYFVKPWIVEEGLYLNISNPGQVFAPAGFVAVTQGRDKSQFITVRAGVGEEGYQLIGPTVTLANFHSQSVTITWRKWLGTRWGFNLVGDYYSNPFYERGGSSLGFFKEF